MRSGERKAGHRIADGREKARNTRKHPPSGAIGDPNRESADPGLQPPALSLATRFLSSVRPGIDETAAALGSADPGFASEVLAAADEANRRTNGRRVTFVVNRNINFTNVCVIDCLFCGYSVRPGDPAGFALSADEAVGRVRESISLGIREVCITGGLNPSLSLSHLAAIAGAIRREFPALHIHAFSPMEVAWLADREGLSAAAVLGRLKDAGVQSMPGTAAEILVDSVRRRICPGKLPVKRWVEIVKTAHRMGIPTTATIMCGHVETDSDVAEHLLVLRRIQEETGGFTEFVPLPFVPFRTALGRLMKSSRGRKRPTTHGSRQGGRSISGIDPGRQSSVVGGGLPGVLDADRMRRLHAVARLFFGDLIPNIQVSWTKLGVELARTTLHAGVSDMGGTLIEENITRLAGGTHGQYLSRDEFIRIIREEGLQPVERDTLYARFWGSGR
ncbi:MAG: CofH family radical SAM protein [Deltaproteobacteria bacterium]|nr:CofH family radical SAM protein [Deltaproteobacteria bacterium]